MYGDLLAKNDGPDARLKWFEQHVDNLTGSQASKIRRALARTTIIGSIAELSGPKVDGGDFELTSLRGKVVLIDLWATWCGPCVGELPEVKKVYDEFRDRGFEVVGFSLDRSREPLEQFLAKHDYDWTQVYIPDEELRTQVADRFGVSGIPATYLIDQEGKITAVNLRGYEQVSKAVANLLGSTAETGADNTLSLTGERKVLTLDPIGEPIDNGVICSHFEQAAINLMLEEDEAAVNKLLQMVKEAPAKCSINIGDLSATRPASQAETYQHLVRSTVILGELFNCGRCNRTHTRFSGGVLISSDGLMLTNYHVFDAIDVNRAEGLFAMTWDGKVCPIEQVLFADKRSDIVLVRLNGDGYKFHAASLANNAPAPMDPVHVLSHPSREFFVVTHGEVSRYVTANQGSLPRQSNEHTLAHWMEITAPFGEGSSGSGVFNEKGEVIGLVSRLHPLTRNAPSKTMNAKNANTLFVEMLLRKCVPLAAIRDKFEA